MVDFLRKGPQPPSQIKKTHNNARQQNSDADQQNSNGQNSRNQHQNFCNQPSLWLCFRNFHFYDKHSYILLIKFLTYTRYTHYTRLGCRGCSGCRVFFLFDIYMNS